MAIKQKRPDLPIGVRFEVGLKRWLVEYAAEHDLTVSQVVRRAVSDYRVKVSLPDALRTAGGA